MSAKTSLDRPAGHYIAHIKLAIPIMFSQMGHLIVQITDSMMLGHYDTTALAASSFAQSVFIIGLVFSIGFTLAMTPLVGAARGAKDVAAAAQWLKNGAAVNLAVALLVTLLLLALYPQLNRMGQTPAVAAAAGAYYLPLVASLAPVILFQTFRQFTEGIGNTRIAAAITVLEALLNIILDYALIFGQWGFPRLGLAGAGLATLIVRLAMPLAFAIFFVRLSLFAPYRAALRPARWSRAIAGRYLKLGLPLGGQFALEVGAFAAGALMMGWLGEIEQAAHQIAIGIASFTFMGASGIAAATTIRVSYYFGAGEQAAMRAAGFAAARIVMAYMGFMALVILALRSTLPMLYTRDSAVIGMAARLLLFAAAFQLVDGLQVVMLAALRALTDAAVPTALAFVAYLLVTLPTSYALAFPLGWREAGIWMGYVAGLALAAGLFLARFHLLSGAQQPVRRRLG
ncbi:MAG: MATE family efflux transporter [Chloracidobacterium sp. CP2_5A]|nr:MAG: MATE family efflux transporter [Chloracidobacterium sp. CP2_5A]